MAPSALQCISFELFHLLIAGERTAKAFKNLRDTFVKNRTKLASLQCNRSGGGGAGTSNMEMVQDNVVAGTIPVTYTVSFQYKLFKNDRF